MHTWIGDKFSATGSQVIGIERDPVLNQIRVCKAVPMNIHCNLCNHNWNPSLMPQTVVNSQDTASVTCPKCQISGDLKDSV